MVKNVLIDKSLYRVYFIVQFFLNKNQPNYKLSLLNTHQFAWNGDSPTQVCDFGRIDADVHSALGQIYQRVSQLQRIK